MSQEQQVIKLQEQLLDLMAERGQVEDLGAAVVMSYMAGDAHLVNYINTHHGHLFTDEQRTALAELADLIHDRAAKIRAVSERDPLSEYVETLNSTVQ